MKTKKNGIIAATTAAVLLMAALLVTNCVEPVNSSGIGDGQTYIKLNVGLGSARTIMPTLVQVNFTHFDITLTSSDGGSTSGSALNVPVANIGNAITVDAGKQYTVTVKAKKASGGVVVAEGEGEIAETTSGANNLNVALKAVFTGDDEGTFSWDITVPTVTTATMDITPISGATTTISNINITIGNRPSSTEDLKAGDYRVTITLQNTNCETRVIEEILHIYPGCTSSYAPTAAMFPYNALNTNVYTITYAPNGGATTPPPATGITHGAGIASEPDPGANGGLEFKGWYTGTAGAWGDRWLFTTMLDSSSETATPVYRSRTLTAQWAAAGPHVTITSITYDGDEGTITLNKTTTNISQAGFIAGTSFDTITIDSTQLMGSSPTYVWKWNGNVISGATTNSLTINSTNITAPEFLVEGSKALTVEITTTGVDARTYGASFEVIITIP
jgi:hypothetical protein